MQQILTSLIAVSEHHPTTKGNDKSHAILYPSFNQKTLAAYPRILLFHTHQPYPVLCSLPISPVDTSTRFFFFFHFLYLAPIPNYLLAHWPLWLTPIPSSPFSTALQILHIRKYESTCVCVAAEVVGGGRGRRTPQNNESRGPLCPLTAKHTLISEICVVLNVYSWIFPFPTSLLFPLSFPFLSFCFPIWSIYS